MEQWRSWAPLIHFWVILSQLPKGLSIPMRPRGRPVMQRNELEEHLDQLLYFAYSSLSLNHHASHQHPNTAASGHPVSGLASSFTTVQLVDVAHGPTSCVTTPLRNPHSRVPLSGHCRLFDDTRPLARPLFQASQSLRSSMGRQERGWEHCFLLSVGTRPPLDDFMVTYLVAFLGFCTPARSEGPG